jgi:hypothetical protein
VTKEELISALDGLEAKYTNPNDLRRVDREQVHLDADNMILQYINDKDISAAFYRLELWYS